MKAFKLLFVTLLLLGCNKEKNRILIFSKTAGFRHESITSGKKALLKIATENNWLADTSEDAGVFTEENLKKYSAVIFLSTTGNILDFRQQNAFERFIQAGGGFVGIHAASDTEYGWPWYCSLVGGNFDSHPHQQNAVIHVTDRTHPSTEMLSEDWKRFDEWYNFKNLNPNTKILGKLDEKTYEGGKNGENHPIMWYHEFDGGRAFYTALGHTNESYSEELFLKHITGGIKYAIGNGKKDYAKCISPIIPDQNRFIKTTLLEGLEEPYELGISKNNEVFFIQRHGKIFLYRPDYNTLKQVGFIPVHTKFEDGLVGLALDPDFSNNKFMYMFYSPLGEVAEYRLSRFTFDNDTINPASEVVMLRIPSQREDCCHTGGSIAFDAKGNLFVSVGDNTTPFKSNGYAPLDERQETKSRDDQRTAANTNDLRGKILRITPLKDGKYTIPEGNLFSKNDPLARAEIYVMGDRNPFRISVDKKTGYLYWGEIGPDAGEDSERGPKGHDEINQARKAGNFGWPYFIGDNKPYSMYNFVTNTVGNKQDPAKPVNNSVNNTGRKELPAAQPAFIWYPYGDSKEFPEMLAGGRSAMAGPVFYSDEYKNSEVKFPPYLNGKLLIYDWVRDYVKVVKMKPNGDFEQIEDHFSHLNFSHPMDMEFAPDGSLYVLEYGYKWWSFDKTTKMSRITFEKGNRPPVPKITVTDSIGPNQFEVQFSAKESIDPDGDKLSYEWRFTGEEVQSRKPETKFTFLNKGIYYPSLTVKDAKGKSSTIKKRIVVGNRPPEINIEVKGNKTFYWDNYSLPYKVIATDREEGKIKESQLKFSFKYLNEGQDLAATVGHQESTAGEEKIDHYLINKSDCKACHQLKDKSVGPSFYDVAIRYRNDAGAVDRLATKIIKGGSGVWGNHAMSAHPQIPVENAKQMAKYILSVIGNKKEDEILRSEGVLKFNEHQEKGGNGDYYFTVSYTDKGIGNLNGTALLKLRSNVVYPNTYDGMYKVHKWDSEGIIEPKTDGSYFYFNDIDLSSIKTVTLQYTSQIPAATMEIRLNKPDGKLIGKIDIAGGSKEWNDWKYAEALLEPVAGKQIIYFVYRSKGIEKHNMLIAKALVFKQFTK